MLGLGLGNQHVHQAEGLTIHNTTTNTQSFDFQGSGDFLSLTDEASGDQWDFIDGSASGTANEPHSYAFWLHRDGSGNYGVISKYGTGTDSYRHFFHSSGSKLLLDTYASGSSYIRKTFNNMSSGQWQHHVWTHSGVETGWKIYVNGVENTSTSTGGSGGEMADSNVAIQIGRATGLSDLDGQMCQFMVWKGVELDQGAVTYLYADGAAHRDPTKAGSDGGTGVYKQPQADGLLCWLPMDDSEGVDDHSGSTYGTHNFTKNGNCNVTTGGGNVPF